MIRLKKDGTPAKKPGRKPDPAKAKKPGPGRHGPRPHVWKSGTDEFRHSMYTPWMKSKAQANFRGEEWDLTFEEYYDLWKEDWKHRGRGGDDMCMTRQDFTGAWDKTNAVIMTRREHLQRMGAYLKETRVYQGKPRGRPSKNKVVYTKLKVSK